MQLKFLSYNVRGLKSPWKRYTLLKEVKQIQADIVCIQESKFKKEIPAEEEVKSTINLSIKEENSENVKKKGKRDKVPSYAGSYHPAGVDYPGLLAYLHVVTVALVSSKRRKGSTFSTLKFSRPTITAGPV
ncbi:uncharacterized protein LOC143809051 [Ranitomeya variabilis]|uniref:uncharacterized protein LOC143809051 n=1 Tax=Ranitomeya variabilis TaxID=490064 RepID=UPI004056237C